MAVFRQTSWPIFDQDFGRFSAKVFGQFSPKTLADFRPKKSPIGQGPWALETPPFEATLAFPIFFGEPSQFSRGALPNLRAKPFIFCRKLKSESKIGHGFMVENRPKKFDAEEPRLRARSHSEPLWSVFGHDFLVSFRPRFWPPNSRPKSDNDLAEIGKRPGRNRKTAIRIFRKW